MTRGRRWGVVLCGGEGRRLRALVRRALGEDRPKQYARLLGPRSFLRQTLDRMALAISVDRTVVVTVRGHAGYLTEEFAGSTCPPYVLLQPEDRGTAAGILHAAHWIAGRDPEATVAIFPADHFILGEATFMAHVEDVARVMEGQPERVALLGAQPTSPEAELGWIEPGPPLDDRGVVAAARGLWEAPSEGRAQLCLASGGLWNTGIAVGRVDALVRLGAEALPELSAGLADVERLADSDRGTAVADQVYARTARASFARAVLERHPERLAERLAVSRLPRVSWCDLGTPRRVLEVLGRMRVRPAWAELPGLPGLRPLAPTAEPAEGLRSGAAG